MTFDKVQIHGDVEKVGDLYRVPITDSRNKYYSSVGFRDEIVFSCSAKIAGGIRALMNADRKIESKLACDIYVRDSKAIAVIYKVEFYNLAGTIGKTLAD